MNVLIKYCGLKKFTRYQVTRKIYLKPLKNTGIITLIVIIRNEITKNNNM